MAARAKLKPLIAKKQRISTAPVQPPSEPLQALGWVPPKGGKTSIQCSETSLQPDFCRALMAKDFESKRRQDLQRILAQSSCQLSSAGSGPDSSSGGTSGDIPRISSVCRICGACLQKIACAFKQAFRSGDDRLTPCISHPLGAHAGCVKIAD